MNLSTRKAFCVLSAVIATVATTVAIPLTAYATGHNDGLSSSSKIENVLEKANRKNNGLIKRAAKSKNDKDSVAIVKNSDSLVDVPKDPEDKISIKLNNSPEIHIGLPNADSAKNASKLPNGTVVFPDNHGSANAVIPTNDGVQMITTISDKSASTRYTYPIEVPSGGEVIIVENGAAVLDGKGSPMLVVSSPWAKDAKGADVPTWFETDGSSLTQVIDHKSDDFAYPITADPSFWGFVACIVGTGAPIGLAIAMALAPNTWGALFAIVASYNKQPMNAARYVDTVMYYCRRAIW